MLVLITNWRGLLLGFVGGAEKGNAGGEFAICEEETEVSADFQPQLGLFSNA